jgi:hypothetical protein
MRTLRAVTFALFAACYGQMSLAQTTDNKFDNTLPEMPLLSVDHRVGKTVFLAVEPYGRLPSAGFGGRIGYFITPDSLVGINYSTGSMEHNDAVFDSTLLELTYKRFFTNSIYMDAGIANEVVDVRYKVIDTANSFARVESKASLKRSGFVLHIGNQWQFSNFTFGCDWLGHHLPVFQDESFSPAAGGDIADEGRQKRAVQRATRSTLQFVRGYVGFSF